MADHQLELSALPAIQLLGSISGRRSQESSQRGSHRISMWADRDLRSILLCPLRGTEMRIIAFIANFTAIAAAASTSANPPRRRASRCPGQPVRDLPMPGRVTAPRA